MDFPATANNELGTFNLFGKISSVIIKETLSLDYLMWRHCLKIGGYLMSQLSYVAMCTCFPGKNRRFLTAIKLIFFYKEIITVLSSALGREIFQVRSDMFPKNNLS